MKNLVAKLIYSKEADPSCLHSVLQVAENVKNGCVHKVVQVTDNYAKIEGL